MITCLRFPISPPLLLPTCSRFYSPSLPIVRHLLQFPTLSLIKLPQQAVGRVLPQILHLPLKYRYHHVCRIGDSPMKNPISNFQFPISKIRGFSMVEMLVVIALLGIISTIVTQVLVISVRSSLKAEIQKEVKQNGDYAISIMERAIRNATDVDAAGCNISRDFVTITNRDTTTTTFTCSSSPNKI